MNIETRKLKLIQEFLNLQSEEIISQLEKILKSQNTDSDGEVFEPMTQDELNQRIDKSESDFQNNRFNTSSEILAKYEE